MLYTKINPYIYLFIIVFNSMKFSFMKNSKGRSFMQRNVMSMIFSQ